MNDKSLKVLDQYELEIRNMRRGRGSFILDTNQGIFLLKEYNGSKQRGRWIEKVCRTVLEAGMQAELPIANREGDYVSNDRDEKRYMLKKWVHGREIDVKDPVEIQEGIRNLAHLHQCMRGFDAKEWKSDQGGLDQKFDKRMRELRKIYHYIKEKRRKNAFELKFLKEYGAFWKMCEQALEMSRQERIKRLQQQAYQIGSVCHGDYNQHNILKNDWEIATVNFENSQIGSQSDDLYDFMRKILEKHNWNLELAGGMLDAYMAECALSREELEELYIKFYFSEKFWKIANHYYNSRKTWMPDRSLQKLDKLVEQFEKRRLFLEYFERKVL